ncbi:MAG: hypothetical protein V4724_37685 [Pseudomonadota bacterium]
MKFQWEFKMVTTPRHPSSTGKGGFAGLASALRAGRVYRREELAQVSNSVDRHLRELVVGGQLKKLAQGLYYAPRQSTFGVVPPDDRKLVDAFLRDYVWPQGFNVELRNKFE